MGEVHNLVVNGTAWCIEELNRFYREGKIKGIMFQLVFTDEQFLTCSGSELGYLEKLGLLEAAKADITQVVFAADHGL